MKTTADTHFLVSISMFYEKKRLFLAKNYRMRENTCFRFKQFTIYHDKCAMKVGTDGVILGAWAHVKKRKRILDIGTGSGLIALMMAQRTSAAIDAIELDEQAAQQAQENVLRSPWSEQIKVLHQNILTFSNPSTYDLIVSNPPYFENDLIGPNEQRNRARHTGQLSYANLLAKAATLLHPTGQFELILPTDCYETIKKMALQVGLFPQIETKICTKTGLPPKRVLVAFGHTEQPLCSNELLIERSRHVYSQDYIDLTKEFYLKM